MITSINPFTQQQIFEIAELSPTQIDSAIKKSNESFQEWRNRSFEERASLLRSAAKELRANQKAYAETISQEMGKPIMQAYAEIEKSANVCEYYAANAHTQLASKEIKTEARESYISYEPIGAILAVMPWNYPFWQVFRFAAPALMAGNVGILKHASNVMKSADNIEKVFQKAGFPEGVFTNLPIRSGAVDNIIKNPLVKAVTLTGSNGAGSAVASVAGSEIKKTVLELGGSNALIVLEDADIDHAVATSVLSRFQNTGQSCIAGKRILVHTTIAEEFTHKFIKAVEGLKSGDPMDMDTYISVMAREELAIELEDIMHRSIAQGAELLLGGKRTKAFFEPTVLAKVSPDMPIFKEETFGPLVSITLFDNEEEAIALSNQSIFGLGASLFTKDLEKAKRLIPLFEDGAVFVNERVQSDARLPFGGSKSSGYGRELSADGIMEFVNVKTVYIR